MKGVYLIINKSNNSVIYVGSSKSLERRLREHKNAITTKRFKDNENLYLFMNENETFFKVIGPDDYKYKEQELIQTFMLGALSVLFFSSFSKKFPRRQRPFFFFNKCE